ncbi:MAG: cytochrome c [Calditrichia bacterium]
MNTKPLFVAPATVKTSQVDWLTVRPERRRPEISHRMRKAASANGAKQIFSAVRNGVRPNGEGINPAMPRWVGNMTDDELRAIWLYLQSVPPLQTELAKQ